MSAPILFEWVGAPRDPKQLWLAAERDAYTEDARRRGKRFRSRALRPMRDARSCACCSGDFWPINSMQNDCPTCIETIPQSLRRLGRAVKTWSAALALRNARPKNRRKVAA